jgi:hypothetical protein
MCAGRTKIVSQRCDTDADARAFLQAWAPYGFIIPRFSSRYQHVEFEAERHVPTISWTVSIPLREKGEPCPP